ncbi:YARHG domain-containing protein [Ferruginibacter sp. SUN106]|uniref:YARHG domain-containing protein n=1 Tax=Ferruginibacter sp. SUN106 TaxID=2978348 RepID=UPI003D3650F6
MFVLRYLITVVLINCTSLAFAQIPKHIFNENSGEEFSFKNFTSTTKTLKQRSGVYHFGESEGEWDLVVLSNNDSLIIQLWSGSWGKDHYTKKEAWLHSCTTFNTVTVNGNKFSFGKYSGQFAEYKEEKTSANTVLLFCDPIGERTYGKDSAELGFYSSPAATFFDNKEYYQLSLAVQPDTYFAGKTKQQLKIMRNTILAKYGLLFQAGGEMEKYFRKKEWYKPFKKEVGDCLTTIEQKNIATIIKLEQLLN